MVLRGGSFLLYLSPPMTIFLRCECGGDGDVSTSLLAYVLLIITVESFMTVANSTSVIP